MAKSFIYVLKEISAERMGLILVAAELEHLGSPAIATTLIEKVLPL